MESDGNDHCAGIGGGGTSTNNSEKNNHNCGTVVIHGGQITASGSNAAGIGSSYFDEGRNGESAKNGGEVVIYGGTVNAIGDEESAGIGGGRAANGGTVKIYGGVVNARSEGNSKGYGAGIGGGGSDNHKTANDGGYGGDVEIYGGRITAAGGASAWRDQGETVSGSGAMGIGIGYERALSCLSDYNTTSYNGTFKVFNGLKVFGRNTPNDDWGSLTSSSGDDNSGKAYTERRKYMEIRSDDVSYKAWDTASSAWQDGTAAQGNYTEVTSASSLTWSTGWYAVKSANVDLSDKTVNVDGTVNLILCDGKSVSIGQLNIADGATLNVYGQVANSGALTTNAVSAAGSGQLNIHGGQITATATGANASSVQCNSVTVYGGVLTGTGLGTGVGISGTNLVPGTGMAVYGGKSADALRYVTAQNGQYDRFQYMKVDAGAAPTHDASDRHAGLSFTVWDLDDRLPTAAGNYWLNRDVTLNATWAVPSGTVNLCLNGNGIRMASGSSAGVIMVPNGATLNLYDCNTEKQHYYYTPSDSLEVTDTYYNYTGTEENLKYKSIKGGYITGGNADTGAGIYVANGGTLAMSGGTVLGNKAGSKGGGIYVGGAFKLSGSPAVKENKAGTGDSFTPDNVCLATGKKITIDAALTVAEPIGLTAETPGVFTDGWAGKMANAEPKSCFKYDTSACAIYRDGDELTLKLSEARLKRGNATTGYAYLSAALADSQHGDTITLLSDVVTAETLVTTKGTGASEHLTLDLNGYGIRMTGQGSVIKVEAGILDLIDNAPTRTGGTGRPTGVDGGYITGGNAEYGGGVYVEGFTANDTKLGSCAMYGGTLIGNAASKDGGGVYAKGTFKFFGGSITGNTASGNGGGIYVDNRSSAQLALSGGSITGNTAGENGGGIYEGRREPAAQSKTDPQTGRDCADLAILRPHCGDDR